MFLRHLSVKGGIPLFAHRFYFKFEVYLIKGSSIFLKIDEPPKKIVKDKRTLLLEGLYKAYSISKELFLDKLIEELKKNPSKVNTIEIRKKILDKKIDNLTVDILKKRIDTVDNKTFSVYGVEKVVEKVKDKSILDKVVHIAEVNQGLNGFTLNKLERHFEFGIDDKKQLSSKDSTFVKQSNSLLDEYSSSNGIIKEENNMELTSPDANIILLDYKQIGEYKNSTGITKENNVFMGKDGNIDIMSISENKPLKSDKKKSDGVFVQTDKQVGIDNDSSEILVEENGDTGLNKGTYNITARNIYAHYLKNGIVGSQLSIVFNEKTLKQNDITLLGMDVSSKFITHDDIKASINKFFTKSIGKDMETPIADFHIPFHLVGNDINELDRSLITYTFNIDGNKELTSIVDKVALNRNSEIDLSLLSVVLPMKRNGNIDISKIMNEVIMSRDAETEISMVSMEVKLTRLLEMELTDVTNKLNMNRLPAYDDLDKADIDKGLNRSREVLIGKKEENYSVNKDSSMALFKSDVLRSADTIRFIQYSNDIVRKYLKNITLVGSTDTLLTKYGKVISMMDLTIDNHRPFLKPLLISNSFHEKSMNFLKNISRKDFSIQDHKVYLDKLRIENAFRVSDTSRFSLNPVPTADIFSIDARRFVDERTYVPIMKPMEYTSMAQRTFVPIMLPEEQIGFDIYQREINYNLGNSLYVEPHVAKDISKSNRFFMDKDGSESIMTSMGIYPVLRNSLYDIFVQNPLSLNNAGLTEMSFADYFSVRKVTEKPMFIDTYTSLSDASETGIYLGENRSLYDTTLIPIIHDTFVGLNKLKASPTTIEQAKRDLKQIELRKSTKFDYDASVQFLKLNKRWWFIKPTNPKTRINIPLIDYPYEQEPVLGVDKHPIEDFTDMGMEDIDISIEIVLELVNIVMHWWHHSYNDLFSGMGDEATQGLMSVLFDWYNLASSQEQLDEKTSKEYERVFRWIRWEAEKVYFDFKNDSENNLIYNGNYYIEILTRNLLEYVEYHHYMVVPLYKSLKKMDIMRAIMGDDPQGDIMTELPDKIMGDRNYVLDGQDDNYSL
jgi:hypothetical protein